MPAVRKDAPRPVDMSRLFDVIEKASGLFVREEYAEAIPLLERILAEDPGNLDAALRLATAHSALGHEERALAAFEKAADIAPDSQDVRTYLALHYARGKEWERAVPLLERIVAEAPDRLPALEALAVVRERQGRTAEAVALRQKIYGMRKPTPMELVRLGELAMSAGQTALAIETFERRAPSRAAPSGTISSSASSTWPPDACRKRKRLSTAFRRRIPPTRWRSSSGPRSACSCTSPIRRRASRPRGSGPTRRPESSSPPSVCFRARGADALRRRKERARRDRRALRISVTAASEQKPRGKLEAPRIVVVPRRSEGRAVQLRLDVVSGLLVEDVEEVHDDLDDVLGRQVDALGVVEVELPVGGDRREPAGSAKRLESLVLVVRLR